MKSMKLRRWVMSVALVTVAVAMVVGMFAAQTANAVDVNWANTNPTHYLNYTWLGGPWEFDDNSVSAPPADGEKIVFENKYSLAHSSIDVAGATLNLPASHLQMGYGGKHWSLYDSATLTPNASPMANSTDYNLGAHASLADAAAASTEKLTLASFDGSKSGTMYFFFPVEITGMFKNPEAGSHYFYGPTTIGTDGEPRNRGWNSNLYYYSDATITTKITNIGGRGVSDGEKTYFHGVTTIGSFTLGSGRTTFQASSSGTVTTLTQSDRSELVMNSTAVSIGTYNWTGGTYVAGADGTLGALGATPTLNAGQVLKISATQTTNLPTMLTVKMGAALAGDMTHAVYSGAGQNITFENDAVFNEGVAPASGALVKADLDAGVGLWLGVTNTQGTGDYWEAGDDGTSPYKGLAMDPVWSQTGQWRGKFKALPGSGDLLFRVTNQEFGIHHSGGPKFYGDSSAIGVGDNTSSTAVFTMNASGSMDMRRHFNLHSQADPDRIKTFTFTRPAGSERNAILNPNQQSGIYADQTINISNGFFNQDAGNWKLEGALNLTDAAWDMGGQVYDALDDTGTITLAGRTTLQLPLGGTAAIATYLEGLEARLTYSGSPTIIFSDNNGMNIYNIDPAASPVLVALMKNSDYGSNHYHNVDIGSGGLYVGDGKFLSNAGTTNATGKYVAHDSGTGLGTVKPGAAGAITMGFAAMEKNLSIDMEVDAPDATLQVGTTDPNRLLTYNGAGGGFVTAIPTMKVTFAQNISAAALNVVSGSAGLSQDTTIADIDIGADTSLSVAGGKTATVTGALTGTGSSTGSIVIASGGTVSPGASVGTLTVGDLTIDVGGTYEVELAAEGNNDLLDISGALTLGGDGVDTFWTLNVLDVGGIEDPTGMSFEIFQYNSVNTIGTVQIASPDFDASAAVLTEIENENENSLWLSGLAISFYPDLDGNNFVNDADLNILLSGDFTQGQLNVLLAAFGGSVTPAGGGDVAAVPEPSTIVLILLGMLGLAPLVRRRRA